MNNLSKIILAIIAGILLYVAFHVLAALLCLAVWVVAIVIVVRCYYMFRRKQKRRA